MSPFLAWRELTLLYMTMVAGTGTITAPCS